MEDEEFEKVFKKIEKLLDDMPSEENQWWQYWADRDEFKVKLKEILEEIYQKGKDNKFKDIGYLDVDEFYPDEKEAKP